MYLIRRVFRCKPGTARRAAEQIMKIGKAYENAGQRSPIRVYTSGGTVPGTCQYGLYGLDGASVSVTLPRR